MAGDTANTRVWDNADVHVAFDLNASVPGTIDDPLGVEWSLVGLLDGGQGFTEARSENVTDHSAWGAGIIRTTRANFKLTRTFTALERNEVVDELMWPDSSTSTLYVPRPARVLVSFTVEDTQLNEKERLITAGFAEVTVNGDVQITDSSIAPVPFLVTIFPGPHDGTGFPLFIRQTTADYGS